MKPKGPKNRLQAQAAKPQPKPQPKPQAHPKPQRLERMEVNRLHRRYEKVLQFAFPFA